MIDRVDHIAYVCGKLEEGIAYIENLLGVAPVISGKHPAWGTHNALLAIGPECYFEVIAPDPNNPVKASIFDFQNKKEDKLLTWVYRPENIQEFHKKGHADGLPFGEILSGSRKKTDGSLLEWQITDLSITLAGGIVPSLIDWKNSPHPAPDLPKGCTLVGLEAFHPNAEKLNQQFQQLGLNMTIKVGNEPILKAIIDSPKGRITL